MAGKKVIVYSTPTCPYCKMAKSYLDENGVKGHLLAVSFQSIPETREGLG